MLYIVMLTAYDKDQQERRDDALALTYMCVKLTKASVVLVTVLLVCFHFVNLKHDRIIWEDSTSTEKMPLSDWSVTIFMELFLIDD